MFRLTQWGLLFFAFIHTTACSTHKHRTEPTEQTTDTPQIQTEFVVQLLEPFGGRISMPKDWYFRERHGTTSSIWILSKENPDEHPYVTGVKLQYIWGVEKGTGKTPENFIREFIDQKKQTVKVLNECAAKEQSFFTGVCLETLEPAIEHGRDENYHILYSLFWGNDLDWVIVMVKGTFEELWEQNVPIFQVMKDFEIIDMARFE